MSKENIVIVSEETAPDNWKCIWEQDIKRTLDKSSRHIAKEKLFVLKNYKNNKL